MKFLLLILFFVSLNAQTIDGIAIMVKDQPITLYEITKAMEENNIPQEQAVELLERKKLEEIEIKERHLSVTKQEIFDDIQRMAEQNKMSVIELYQAIQSSQGLSETKLKEKIKEKILNQKLYNAIAFSNLEQPNDAEIEEYYKLHKTEFQKPSSYTVLVYQCPDKNRLQEKIDNPMFYSPDVTSEENTLEAAKMNPRLAELLDNTSLNSFTQIVPAPNSGFMSFYLKAKGASDAPDLEAIRPEISNALMGQKRETILKDYFGRQRLNAGIKVIRLPRN
ncbi:MAG: peptidylprolyl isomerase [Helicobacteraceae bacterium]|nr:peptidylprolyl isomerase [Helicobacteraceae bacterium]